MILLIFFVASFRCYAAARARSLSMLAFITCLRRAMRRSGAARRCPRHVHAALMTRHDDVHQARAQAMQNRASKSERLLRRYASDDPVRARCPAMRERTAQRMFAARLISPRSAAHVKTRHSVDIEMTRRYSATHARSRDAFSLLRVRGEAGRTPVAT